MKQLDRREVGANRLWKVLKEIAPAAEQGGGLLALYAQFIVAHLDKVAARHDPLGTKKVMQAAQDLVKAVGEDNPRNIDSMWWKYTEELSTWMPAPSFHGPAPSPESIRRVFHATSAELKNADITDWLIVLDLVFQLSREGGPTRRFSQGRRLAIFAAALSGGCDSIEEETSRRGDLAVLASGYGRLPIAYCATDPSSPSLVGNLRLLLNGVRLVGPGGNGGAQFKLIDQAPLHRALPPSMHRPPGRYHWPRLIPALAARHQRTVAVVTFAAADGPAGRLWREELLEGQQLRAVVALPSASVGNASVALVLSNAPENIDGTVLMVDLAAMSLEGLITTAEMQMRLAGQICAAALGWDSFWPEEAIFGEAEGDYRRLWRRAFPDGYRDIRGLCERVDLHRLYEQEFQLAPRNYLREYADSEMFSRLPSAPIVHLLDADDGAKCVYVIGSNGEGKSRMLATLAAERSSRGRPVVTMAFGLHDRFDSEAKRNVRPNYRYRGLLTSTTKIDVTRLVSRMTADAVEISRQPRRLGILRRLMSLAGFDETVSLVPRESAGRGQRGLPDSVLRLDGEGNPEADLLSKDRVIALQRKEWVDTIVPYPELSSGEQQIVLMIIKLVHVAEAGEVIFLDEPETSLHVRWQRLVPALLHEIAMAFDLSIVTATHSPVLIAGTSKPADYCFAAENGELRPLGDKETRSVGRTLLEGFRTYTPGSLDLYEECARIVAGAMTAANTEVATVTDRLEVAHQSLGQLDLMMDAAVGVVDDVALEVDRNLVHRARLAVAELAKESARDNTMESK